MKQSHHPQDRFNGQRRFNKDHKSYNRSDKRRISNHKSDQGKTCKEILKHATSASEIPLSMKAKRLRSAFKKARMLRLLRRNARIGLSEIGKKTRTPVTTVYDYYQGFVRKGIIKRHISIIDFRKLGLFYRSFIILRGIDASDSDGRDALKELLLHPSINSAAKIGEKDYLLDTIFPTTREYFRFMDLLEEKEIDAEGHDIVAHIKKEAFFN